LEDDEELHGLAAGELEGIDIEAYKILVRMHNAVGWDEMLEIRKPSTQTKISRSCIEYLQKRECP